MSTELTDPIIREDVATRQDITKIYLLIEHGQLEYHIQTKSDEEVFASNVYHLNFSDAPPAVKDHLRAVLDDVRNHARANGYLGEGTDTDPIG